MFVRNSATFYSFMAAIAIALSCGCSGRVEIDLAASGSAKLRTQTKVDGVVVRGLVERIATFSGNEAPPADAPFFSAEAMKEAVKDRKDISLDSVEIPDSNSMKASFTVASLMKMGAASDGSSSFFTMKTAPGQKTLAFRVDRDNVALLPELIPAIGSGFFEMLAPPSLYGDDISEKEYRDNSLALFVGAKNLPAVDKAATEIRITPPGTIVSQKGGRVEGNTFIASLPLLTILVLEKPYEFSLSWKE